MYNNYKLVFIDRNVNASWDFYKAVFDKNKDTAYKTISEYKGCDFHYNIDKEDWTKHGIKFWELYRALNLQDIINRCRVLRSLSSEFARRLIMKSLSFCLTFFEKNKFESIIIFTADRYTIDILIHVATYYEIKIVGVGGSFLPGTKRITLYGEPNFINFISNDDIEKLYLQLKSKFKSSGRPNIIGAYKAAIRNAFSILIRYVYHYLLLNKIFGKLNYDYFLVNTQPKEIFLNLIFYRVKPYDIKTINELINVNSSQSVYIPLHFHPEATVDYWTDKSYKAFYLECLCEVISTYREMGIQVFLKEHPAMYLHRDKEFYQFLKAYDNVKIIWPFLDTIDVLKYFHKIIIWTGTSGIESAVNGKNIYLYSRNYWDNGFFKDWKDILKNSQVNEEQAKIILKNFLENLCYE